MQLSPVTALRAKRGPLSAEQKAKISASLKGRVVSAETRLKISISNTGKTKGKSRWPSGRPDQMHPRNSVCPIHGEAPVRRHFDGARGWYCKQCNADYKKKRHRRDPRVRMLNSAKRTHKTKGVPFDLEREDIVIPTYCPVLGIELAVNDGAVGPNSPSLDKIIPSLGYVKGNVRVISHRANTIKSDATIDELRKVVADLERLLLP